MIEKLIKVLNKDLATKFNADTLKQYKFIPINEQNGVLFVAGVANSPDIENLLKQHFSSQIKFIPLPNDQINQLFEYIFYANGVLK